MSLSPENLKPREDNFRGDDAALLAATDALLALDERGALVPHGVGGHARVLLGALAARLAARSDPKPPVEGGGGEASLVLIEPDALLERIQDAFLAGCRAVHENYQPDPDPDFAEASWDYAASLDFTADTRPYRETTTPVSMEEIEEALRPFAKAAKTQVFTGIHRTRITPRDSDPFFGGDQITWGNVRKAQAILSRLHGVSGEGMEASRSQPSGMGPSDHIGPKSQHSDGEG